jgi:N-acetylmuramoyl-L-alanine amidase
MARAPFATWVPVEPRPTQRRIRPVGLVCHTAVSNSTLLKPTGTTRWHFYLNKAGELYQFFDTTISAACQLDGNYWTAGGESRGFLSCESWDGAGVVWDGEDTDRLPPWTDPQMRMWARLGAWLHDTHGIPPIKATGPRGTGIGYHSQYRNTKPYRWTRTHVCPGPQRIAQMPTLIRMMNDAAKGDDEMPLSPDDVKKVAEAVWGYKLQAGPYATRVGGYPKGASFSAGALLVGVDAHGHETHRMWSAVLAGIAELGESSMPEPERTKLAAEIAAKVDRLRVVLEHDAETPTP